MTRLAFLGIDGLDLDVIDRHIDELPTLRRYRDSGVLRRLPSIFPPDSIPAWITIFTGRPPADHGVIESIDYLASNPARAAEQAPALLAGQTFWDRLSEQGARVCVVNPFLAYPAWPVNGTMIAGPVFIDSGKPSLFPPSAANGDPLPQLGGIVDFPTPATIDSFVRDTLETTREQAAFALQLLERETPDFLFLNILTIDRLQHFLWRFYDPTDPTYPGDGPRKSAVLDIYRLADEIVAEFEEAIGQSGIVALASDHGHGMRPPEMLFLDELLRREGFANSMGFRSGARTYLLEKAKRGALRTAFALEREKELYALARRLPGRKALKTSSYAIDGQSLARASRAFGRNSSGGVDLAEGLADAERDALLERICSLLLKLVDSRTGERVCLWAKPREEVLSGVRLDRYPDVLFQLDPAYGVDFGVYGPLFGPDTMHRRISGGHRPEGVFAASSMQVPFIPESIADLYRFVVETVAS